MDNTLCTKEQMEAAENKLSSAVDGDAVYLEEFEGYLLLYVNDVSIGYLIPHEIEEGQDNER